jgi:hypothetical protein
VEVKRGGPLKRRTPLRPKPPERLPRPAPATLREVARRDFGRCIVCVYRGQHPQPAGPPHHVLPKARWPQWNDVSTNLVTVCLPHHDEHERAHRRISWEALPAPVQAWVRQQARGDAVVAAFVERAYPHD